jgi:pimeloyl-ACP methyl ester carboxylesterase
VNGNFSMMASDSRSSRSFVLVHGGWCYARAAEILRAQGQRVFTPTLTGLGERSHLARGTVNCSTHIQDVLNVIHWERLKDVILCGHSYGGMVVGGVADKIPDRIATIVYLDAVVPENRRSLLDLTRSAEEIRDMLDLAADHAGYALPAPSAESLNVNKADRDMVDELSTPHPFASCIERLKLAGAFERVPKKIYILATNWRGRGRPFYERRMSDPGWSTFKIDCGRDVMLDEPQQLAEILMRSR